ncbi:MAG: hypothetical protein GF350_08475 [Chitinivibrionales bacterium]|nr:hypothetical protein [Chitinivibrionales bacterium]
MTSFPFANLALIGDEYHSGETDRASCRVPAGSDIMGYLYLVQGVRPANEQLLDTLRRLKKPVAVLVEGGAVVPPRFTGHTRYVHIFKARSSENAGRAVARCLLDLGHIRIAYISPYHRARWSRFRHEGLDEIYRAAGHEDAVPAFTIDKNAILDYHERAREHIDIAAFKQLYTDWKKRMPRPFQFVLDPAVEEMTGARAAMGEVHFQTMRLFDRALADTSITAWVTANDGVAVPALDYLARKRMRVPRDISIVGFDFCGLRSMGSYQQTI